MKVSILSPTKQEFDGVIYYRCGRYFQRKGKRLHRAVWEATNGPVPKGYHVHHIDEDVTHNDIENLRLIPGPQHLSIHQEPRHEYQTKHIKEMQDLAKEWHASDEGRAWHGEHMKKTLENREECEYTCGGCGKLFTTKHMYGKEQNTFCSNGCKAKYRRDSGVDDVKKVCEKCGAEFSTNRYRGRRLCEGCWPRRR